MPWRVCVCRGHAPLHGIGGGSEVWESGHGGSLQEEGMKEREEDGEGDRGWEGSEVKGVREGGAREIEGQQVGGSQKEDRAMELTGRD